MNLKPHHLLILALLTCACNSSKKDDTSATAEAEATFVSSFDFQPEKPVDGKLLGIIELSFSGFNSFIIKIDDQDRWSLEKAVYGESFVDDQGITLEHVLSSIESYKSEMTALGLDENTINLVVSSSAYKNEQVKKIADQLWSQDIGLISIDPEQEAAYAFQASVPEHLQDQAFLLDIGSGSSKISWMQDGKVNAVETYGSKYFMQDVSDLDVYHELKDALAQIPGQNKSICFLVGGTAFKLAKETNARAGRYTILQHPDEYSSFSEEQDKAGLNIYNAIYSEATYNYVFDWDANFTIGILMNVN